jgi:hypothetical protein
LKPVAIIISILYFIGFHVTTAGFIWRYTFDFPLAGLALQLVLLVSFCFSVWMGIYWIKRKTVSSKRVKQTGWISFGLAVLACTQWGAFGLGALMTTGLFFVLPWITGKKSTLNETRVLWILLIQSVFITGPLWLQFLQV